MGGESLVTSHSSTPLGVNKSLVRGSIELLFPLECVVCGADGALCCRACNERIIPRLISRCISCERVVSRGKQCPSHQTPVTSCIEAAHYTETVRRLIHGLKYDGVVELVPLLGGLMARSVARARLPRSTVITAVPLTRRRCNERGFNQAELLARFVARELNFPFQSLLIKVKKTKQQALLSGDDRRTNLLAAFRLAPSIIHPPSSILLIDDVATTGSTLIECAKVLRKAGAQRVYGSVIARG